MFGLKNSGVWEFQFLSSFQVQAKNSLYYFLFSLEWNQELEDCVYSSLKPQTQEWASYLLEKRLHSIANQTLAELRNVFGCGVSGKPGLKWDTAPVGVDGIREAQ